MAKLSPYAFFQELDNNGDPLSGGKLYTYEAGTSTPKVTYTTEDESTANPNPIILDSSGRADIWLDSGSYKFVLDDSNDVNIATVDNITGDASNDFGSEVIDISTNTLITLSNRNNLINCTAPLTLTLIDVSTADEGFLFIVKNSSSGNVIIDPDGSELIDGAATKTLGPGGSLIIDCTGTAWITFVEDVGNVNSRDNSFTGDNTFSGLTSFLDAGELTISSGVITLTGTYHRVDTEADASSDDLDTINTGSDGLIVVLRAENTARTVVIRDGTGNIETADGNDIFLDNTEKTVLLQYDSSLSKWIVISSPVSTVTTFGSISGLVTSNDADVDHDINITAGQATDSTNDSYLTLSSEITKQIDVTWAAGDDAGGLFSGTVAADTTYHVFIIENDSDGSIDAGFDISLTAANIPSGYTKYRRVASVVTDGSANIINFIQRGDDFYYDTPILDVDNGASGTTANTATATVPADINVKIYLNTFVQANGAEVYFSSLDNTDLAPSVTASPLASLGSATTANFGNAEVWSNTSSQYRYRSSANTTVRAATLGYVDARGK